jgi:sn-glycerol 3-phosphate transport system substrate-binding protein
MKALALFAAVGLALLVLATTACGGNEEVSPSPTTEGEAATPSTGHVAINFWHAMTAANEDTLKRLTDEFNASQDRITVSLLYQGTYDDNLNKILASLRSGDLPALAQLEDTSTQIMADSGAAVPAQDFIDAEGYDLSDFLPQVLNFYQVEGRLVPMPFNVSNPILYYNKTAFEKAGLDPEQPPTTLDEVREYSQKIVDAGLAPHGMALDVRPWYLEHILAKANVDYLNNGNGREARATEALFDNEEGLALFTWWKDMVDSGLALNAGRNPSDSEQLYAVAGRQAEMAIGTSAALRSSIDIVNSAHQSGELLDIELGTGPMPGLPGGTGGVLVSGGSLYIMADRPPEEQQAAWEFVKFLVSPETQAKWFSGSGYIPIRKSSHDLAPAMEVIEQYPQFQVAVDQLAESPVTTATAGPLMGAYSQVQEIVTSAIEAMILQGKDPADALADAAAEATDAIQKYNSRVE